MPPANLASPCGYTPNRIQSVHGSKEQESHTGSSGLGVERKADVRLTQRRGFIFVLSPVPPTEPSPLLLRETVAFNCRSQHDRWFHSLPGMWDNASGVAWAWTHATSGLVSVGCWPDYPQDPPSKGPAILSWETPSSSWTPPNLEFLEHGWQSIQNSSDTCYHSIDHLLHLTDHFRGFAFNCGVGTITSQQRTIYIAEVGVA